MWCSLAFKGDPHCFDLYPYAAVHQDCCDLLARFVEYVTDKPRLAVYAHISDADLITPARKAYSGPLEAGEDLMTIEIGETIAVRRATR